MKNVRIGEILLKEGVLSQEQLNQALAIQQNMKERKFLGEVLIDRGFVTELAVFRALSNQLDIKIIGREEINPTPEALSAIPKNWCLKLRLIPLFIKGDTVYVASDNAVNYYGFKELSEEIHYTVRACLCMKKVVLEMIEKYYAAGDVFSAVSNVNKDVAFIDMPVNAEATAARDGRVKSSPYVKLSDSLIEQAVRQRASDIHIEPKKTCTLVRYRIDGDLVEVTKVDKKAHSPLVNVFKISSSLDITETRAPQDGRFKKIIDGKEISFRISTLPCAEGEKIVVRVLGDSSEDIVPINQLGMTSHNMNLLSKLIHNPNGVIYVTGPTGSGKTTTIYSVLSEVATPRVNVTTVEDPVEKVLDNINQVHINVKAGMTFAGGLRSIMRQDPDIIMVGEIRDFETAETASQAAITGHLVLSTIHTNDAPSTFMRLINMGVEPFVVADSVIGVIAQRLVKRICPHCKEEYAPTDVELEYWGGVEKKKLPVFYHGRGCKVCNNTGYLGRVPIHEIIVVTPEIRELVARRASAQEIKGVAVAQGFCDMRSNAMQLVEEGITTIGEMCRTITVLQ